MDTGAALLAAEEAGFHSGRLVKVTSYKSVFFHKLTHTEYALTEYDHHSLVVYARLLRRRPDLWSGTATDALLDICTASSVVRYF